MQRKTDLHQELIRSAEELDRRMEAHRWLLRVALDEGQVIPGKPHQTSGQTLQNRRERDILLEAIEVLEGTRKAFKSKQLEMLRKKMIRVLAEGSESLLPE